MRSTTRFAKVSHRAAILLLSSTTALSAMFVAVPMPKVFAAPAVIMQSVHAHSVATAAELQLVKEEIVTSGVVLRTYKWHPESEKREATDLRVLAINLHNPYVRLDVMNGQTGHFNTRQSVLGMTRETEAVAGINASFFHMNLKYPNPLGVQVQDHQLTASPLYLNGWHAFGVTVDREPVIGEFTFDGTVMTERGATYELKGINKPIMRDTNNELSHTDSIFMYTSAWGPYPRAADSNYRPTEVLVIDGVAVELSIDAAIATEIPEDGYILRGEGRGAEFLREHVQVGEPVYTDYMMLDRKSGETVDPTQFQMLIGGHTILVEDGVPATFTTNINDVSGASQAARSAVGYSADGRYVYLVTADKTSGKNGMTLAEMQQAMIQLGVWKGINLDGGGSTTMAARHLGDQTTSLVNRPAQTTMRQVVNGIGVYTTAPKGNLAGMTIESLPFLFVGERASLSISAYDEYYNPMSDVKLSDPGFTTEVEAGYGRFADGYFIPERKGTAKITITHGSVQATTEAEIVDRKDIESLSISAGDTPIRSGSMLELSVRAQLADGRSRVVPADAINWRLEGFEGSVSDGVLTVERVDEQATARLIATYDGMSTSLLLPVYVRNIWADFDTVMPPVSLDALTRGAEADYSISDRVGGHKTESNVLRWDYDFSRIPQYSADRLPQIAIEFNSGQGVELSGEPRELALDVYGDGKSSNIWFEATDTNGQLYTIPIGKIDWTGWRTVQVDLSALQASAPLTVMRLIQESPVNLMPSIDLSFMSEEEVMQLLDPTVTQGELAIDNLSVEWVRKPEEPAYKTIHMKLDNPTVTVNGQPLEIDQAPVALDGSTMVPIRFIIEAMDGEVSWDPSANKVTLIRGKELVELWLDETELNFNGRKVKAPVPPVALNSRTLIPVRILSEQLGWNVKWDNDTKTVTLTGRKA